MKHYSIPEASLVRLQASDVIANSGVFAAVYEKSNDSWDLGNGSYQENYSAD